ncbi:MAG: hypothetical protein OCU12_02780 [Methanophagales archaeon]|nr:hypothetical protein [Methanophagales archaeon]
MGERSEAVLRDKPVQPVFYPLPSQHLVSKTLLFLPCLFPRVSVLEQNFRVVELVPLEPLAPSSHDAVAPKLAFYIIHDPLLCKPRRAVQHAAHLKTTAPVLNRLHQIHQTPALRVNYTATLVKRFNLVLHFRVRGELLCVNLRETAA